MKRSRFYLVAIIVAVPGFFALSYLNNIYLKTYTSASEGGQLLMAATFTASIGLLIHFIKKHPKFQTKQQQLIFELFEVLMLVLTPALSSFKLIKEIAPHQILPLIIPLIVSLFIWYLIMLFITCNPKNAKEGKAAFLVSTIMYWALLVMFIPFVSLGIVFDPHMR